jgi:hypothetical protein
MAIIQPRVARNELPWVDNHHLFFNPERVVSSLHDFRHVDGNGPLL